MADRREMLEAALDEALEPATEEVQETEVEQEVDAEPARNEKGQFVAKEEPEQEEEPEVEASAEEEQTEEEPAQETEVVDIPKPTTWKKDLLPLWDKIAKGETLTKEESKKHLEYLNQRENEFKKGVSVYKAEAERAKALEEAINPFVPELQAQGIHPAAWINNLGRAHMILSQAPYEQKMQMFQKLASDYGIQFNPSEQQYGVEQQQLDPYAQQLYQQLQQVNQEVSSLKGRYEQEDNQRLMSEINRVAQDTERFPHFEAVREQMAQLLENNLAPDLETAYAKAVRLQDDVWQLEQNRLLNQAKQQQSKQQQVAKAKATAVSPKSVTPNGMVATGDKNKDRRSMLEAQIDSAMNGRF